MRLNSKYLPKEILSSLPLSNLIFTNLFSKTCSGLIINRRHEWRLFKYILSKSCLPIFWSLFSSSFQSEFLEANVPSLCPNPPQLWSGNIFRNEIFLNAQANLWRALLTLYYSPKQASTGLNVVRLHTLSDPGMGGKMDKHKATLSKKRKSCGILFLMPSRQPFITGLPVQTDPGLNSDYRSNFWSWAHDCTPYCLTLSQVLKLSEPVSSSVKEELTNNTIS